ncbi:MAG: hypothetical protein H0X66_17685 [Verrucomicrobia bacterium]|nr:hypothetical protein [Verrucomicrobiota bacterium]
MSEPIADSTPEANRQRLTTLRESLLVLHKALLDSERIQYEQTFGTIHSPYEFLQRVISDPWFAWLHPLSEFLVFIDEMLEREEPLQLQDVDQIRKQVRALLVASEEGEGFSRSYFEALQREPDVVLAHAAVVKQLSS